MHALLLCITVIKCDIKSQVPPPKKKETQKQTLLLGNEIVNAEEDNWMNIPHEVVLQGAIGWSESDSLTKLDFMLVPLHKAPLEICIRSRQLQVFLVEGGLSDLDG